MSFATRLAGWFGKRKLNTNDKPNGIIFDHVPGIVYAVGDVHGCLSELKTLDSLILTDCKSHGQPAVIINLGDHIDRGPESAAVLEYLQTPLTGSVRRFCLMGNHEAMFLDFLNNPHPAHDYLSYGGVQTLRSYGIMQIPADKAVLDWHLKSAIPPGHVNFVKDMPLFVHLPGTIFVHAGLDPGQPLIRQSTQTMLWRRNNESGLERPVHGQVVIHGHTPVDEVECYPYRCNVDTGAYKSGKLSVIRRDLDGTIRALK